MNKQKFIEYIHSSGLLKSDQIKELMQLLADYPYFSIARYIIARAAKEANHGKKGMLLSSAAIHATDRKHLKKFVNGELIFLKDEPDFSSDSGNLKTQPSYDNNLGNLEAPKEGEIDQIIDELQRDMNALKQSRMHFIEIQNQLNEEESTITPEREIISKQTFKKDETNFEMEIPRNETYDNDSEVSYDLEALKKEFAQEDKPNSREEEYDFTDYDEDTTQREENDEDNHTYLDESPSYISDKKPERNKKRPAKADRDTRKKVKRADLERFMNMDNIPDIKEDQDHKSEEETEKFVARRSTKKKTNETSQTTNLENHAEDPVTKVTRKYMMDFGKTESVSMSVSRASPSQKKRKRSTKSNEEGIRKNNKDDEDSGGSKNIIDRFLDENPSIKRKVKSTNKNDLSVQSSKFDENLVSETLANIYAKQGNIKRAKLIYKKLSLKFPEKKSYFATLVKELKNY